MSVRAVDPTRSRIVLVGTPHYADERLPDVPVVTNNVADLAAVFTDPELGGFDVGHCVATPPEAGLADIGETLSEAAEKAEDLLLIYYSGHGLLDRRGKLFLSLAATRPDRLGFTGLPFDTLREAFLDSNASSRVVILDSCFSGRAIGQTLAGDEEAVLGQLEVAGTYTLTAAPANRTALILPGEQHTAFTERLLSVLRRGLPRGGPMLSLGEIHRHLRSRLKAEGLPTPQVCGTDTADLLGLVRNRQAAPAELPEELRVSLESRFKRIRLGAVAELGEWLRGSDPQLVLAARAALRNVAEDDNPEVAAEARRLVAPREPPTLKQSRKPASDLAKRGTEALRQAQAIAAGIVYTDWKAEALADIARAVAHIDPDRAVRIAKTIDEAWWREPALVDIACAAAISDPDHALRIVSGIGPKHREEARSRVAQIVAASNSTNALIIADDITDGHWKMKALFSIARAMAATDEKGARGLIAEAEQINAGVTNEWALADLAKAAAVIDASWALGIVRGIESSPANAVAMTSVARVIAETDPYGAARLAEAISHPSERVLALAEVARVVKNADPILSRLILQEAERSARRSYNLTPKYLHAIAAADSDHALRLVPELRNKFARAEALAGIAETLAAGDPERAWATVDRIKDPTWRARALAGIARVWFVQDRLGSETPGGRPAGSVRTPVSRSALSAKA